MKNHLAEITYTSVYEQSDIPFLPLRRLGEVRAWSCIPANGRKPNNNPQKADSGYGSSSRISGGSLDCWGFARGRIGGPHLGSRPSARALRRAAASAAAAAATNSAVLQWTVGLSSFIALSELIQLCITCEYVR